MRVAVRARPAGSESSGWDGLSIPGERVATRRLGAAPSDDCRKVVARLNGAAEVGRCGIVDLSLHDVHRHAVDGHRRARFGIGIDDGVFNRVDVNLRPGVGRQGGDGEVVVVDDGANLRAGSDGDRAKGFRPHDSDVGVERAGGVVPLWALRLGGASRLAPRRRFPPRRHSVPRTLAVPHVYRLMRKHTYTHACLYTCALIGMRASRLGGAARLAPRRRFVPRASRHGGDLRLGGALCLAPWRRLALRASAALCALRFGGASHLASRRRLAPRRRFTP